MKIKGHTILITGGTSGIGKALALALRNDNTVIITGRSPERLEEARQAGLTAIPCDLTKSTDLDKLLLDLEQHFPQLDVLINNAGIQYNYDWLVEGDAHQKIQHELDTNLTGTIQLTQRLLPLLSTKPAQILNLASALAAVPKSDGLVYSASKAGLINFTRGLRKVLKRQSIRVIEVIPPVTDTHMTAGRAEHKMPPNELTRIIIRQWAAGRERIAPLQVKFLLQLNRFFPALAARLIS